MKSIIVRPDVQDGGIAATVGSTGPGSTDRLWIRSTAITDYDAQDLTPWLMTLLPYAMRTGERLILEGRADAKVLAALPRIQAMLAGWYPRRMRPIEVVAAEATRAVARNNDSAVLFTAGLDSFYTLMQGAECTRYVVSVFGFDIPLRSVRVAAQVRDCARRAALDAGAEYVDVVTNSMEFTDRVTDWGSEQHGSSLAAVAYVHHGIASTFAIGATSSDAYLRPWGSHPDLDPLWSSTVQDIYDHASDVTRPEKAEVVMQLDSARRGLRVCTAQPFRDDVYNCGKCEKCVRTAVNLYVAGFDGACLTLPPVNVDAVRKMALHRPAARDFARENLHYLRSSGTESPEIEKALRQAIARGAAIDPLWRLAKHTPGARRTVRMLRSARRAR